MTDTPAGIQSKMKGIAVSPGITIGKARVVDRSGVKIVYQFLLQDEQLNRQVERFKEAIRVTEEQLLSLKERMPKEMRSHAVILDTHLMILKDSKFADATIDRINKERINAEWALKKSLGEIKRRFSEVDDDYISGRISDVEGVAERVLRNLSGENEDILANVEEQAVIVAHDLSPADAAEMDLKKVMGFITDVGGRTSHTAIMAEAMEIPAVLGLERATRAVEDGDLLLVDGNTGDVIVNPDPETISYYRQRQKQIESYKSQIVGISHLPAETVDGHRIAIMANVEFQEEVSAVKAQGGEGIGLYRTEFLYLRSRGLPLEEELFEDYRTVAELISPYPVTIRTLDLGGDKFSSHFEISKELNPALGLRAIRFCLKEPEIFKIQLRAILRASHYGTVKMMFPMISGLEEIKSAREIVEQVKAELDRDQIPYDRDIKTGIMIEIPSAVTLAPLLAEHVDFFSIGTNDLIQYALAIDRINEQVAYMYQPFHPAILKMIQATVEAGQAAGIGVSLCGEMAGDPLCVAMLVGLGIDELSMTTRAIPLIKQIVRAISMKEAREDFESLTHLDAPEEVRVRVLDRIKVLVPDLEPIFLPDAEGETRESARAPIA